jgi:hypothetical protein
MCCGSRFLYIAADIPLEERRPMHNLLRRLRGAIGMGIFWALGGAFLGGLIELLDNIGVPWGWIDGVDMWIPLFAIPGFFGGIAFSLVLGIAGHHRKFEELSLLKFTLWGAISGLLLGGAALLLGTQVAVLFVLGAPALFCATAATGTLALARMGERPALPAGGEEG